MFIVLAIMMFGIGYVDLLISFDAYTPYHFVHSFFWLLMAIYEEMRKQS